jgi:hypothetical protein
MLKISNQSYAIRGILPPNPLLLTLRKRKVDVFIGNHVWNNDTERKAIALKKTGENQFIDSDIWYKFLSFCEKRLYETIDKD